MAKASSSMWWIIIGAVIALVAMIILLLLFTDKTGDLSGGLEECLGKGGKCEATCVEGTVQAPFTCEGELRCCIGFRKTG